MDTINTEEINLVLVDDHAMFREALARVLDREPGFKVVGQFSSSTDAAAALHESSATMILLDVDLGAERAIDFMMECQKIGFKGKVLVVTAGTSGQEALQLIQAGVAGILHKNHTTEVLSEKIRQIAAGDVFLENEYLGALYRSADRSKPQQRRTLTERDKVVLRFIFQGWSNRQIGDRLKISESGVKSALRQLFDKLGVRTRAQLVKIALEDYRDQL